MRGTRLKRGRVEFIFLPLGRAPRREVRPEDGRQTFTRREESVLVALLRLPEIGFHNDECLLDRIRRELIRKVRTEKRERGEGNGLRRVFHWRRYWRRSKENPDTLPMVGVSVLRRSMALRHSERDCSGLLAAFDLFNDDGADDKGDGDASR